MNQFFTSGDQSIGVSASVSVLPMNIQDWFPLGWTDWLSPPEEEKKKKEKTKEYHLFLFFAIFQSSQYPVVNSDLFLK